MKNITLVLHTFTYSCCLRRFASVSVKNQYQEQTDIHRIFTHVRAASDGLYLYQLKIGIRNSTEKALLSIRV